MKNVVLIKDNKVTSIVFAVDADDVVLNNEAKPGDVYDAETGLFSAPPVEVEAPMPELPSAPPEDPVGE